MKTAAGYLDENYGSSHLQTVVEIKDCVSLIGLMQEYAKYYATEKVKETLRLAAERTNYPYRDEYGCMCNVPAIVLELESEILDNINKEK